MTSNKKISFDMYIYIECGDVVTIFSESLPIIIMQVLTIYIYTYGYMHKSAHRGDVN